MQKKKILELRYLQIIIREHNIFLLLSFAAIIFGSYTWIVVIRGFRDENLWLIGHEARHFFTF